MALSSSTDSFTPIWSVLRFRYPSMKRANLLFLALVVALCSAFYLLGISQRGGSVPSPSSSTTVSLFSSLPCSPTPLFSSSNSLVSSSSTSLTTLDFNAHHTADETISSQAATDHHFPVCDAKYSEYTPCEDIKRSLRFDRKRLIYKERHCPTKSELLKCLIPAPKGYRNPFPWPESRDYAWFANVPHKHLAIAKAVQNWVKVEGDRFKFPGGGTMFARGADAYINEIDKLINLHDGNIRSAIDTGCGVASFGAYLLSSNVLTMSFAPKDSHEAQVQFALERGVPAMIGILATNRLPYPSRAFDMAHCSRCLIPWQLYDGLFLLELDRILRPGGYWVLSGPPINWRRHYKGWQRTKEDLSADQNAIESMARSLCWKKVKEKGDIAVWQKPTNHIHCKASRKVFKKPNFCNGNQDPDSAWYTKMETCISPLPETNDVKETAGGELRPWPERLTAIPPRIKSGSIKGVTAEDFRHDTEVWRRRVGYYKTLVNQLEQKGRYRNLLDMNAKFGGFAAALVDDPLWVMNVVPTAVEVNTLGIVYERGLIGTYQDWCEAMSTYPRTYDLLHADNLFSLYKDRCDIEDILLEMDRILRPEGTVILRDDVEMLVKVKKIVNRMKWDSQIVDHEDGPFHKEKVLLVIKTYWTADNDNNQNEQAAR